MNFKLISLISINLFGLVTSQGGPIIQDPPNNVAQQLASKGMEKCTPQSKLPLSLDVNFCNVNCTAKVGQNVSLLVRLVSGNCKCVTLRGEYSSPLTSGVFLPVGPINLCDKGVQCPTQAGQTITIVRNEPVFPLVVQKMEFKLRVRLCCEAVDAWQVALGPNCATPESESTCIKLKLTIDPADAPKIAPFPAPVPFPAIPPFPGFPAVQPPNNPSQG